MARGYANRRGPDGKVIAARVTFTNPLHIDFLAPNTRRWYENKRRVWRNKGYDGVIVGGTMYIAFSPSQINIIEAHPANR